MRTITKRTVFPQPLDHVHHWHVTGVLECEEECQICGELRLIEIQENLDDEGKIWAECKVATYGHQVTDEDWRRFWAGHKSEMDSDQRRMSLEEFNKKWQTSKAVTLCRKSKE